MTLQEFSEQVAAAAELHPEAEVVITTLDDEYNVHSTEFQTWKNGFINSIIFSIQSDEEF